MARLKAVSSALKIYDLSVQVAYTPATTRTSTESVVIDDSVKVYIAGTESTTLTDLAVILLAVTEAVTITESASVAAAIR